MADTVLRLAQKLSAGAATSAAIIDAAIEKVKDPAGEGARVFTLLATESARAEAAASDQLRKGGVVPSLLAGLPISVKDFLDTRGHTTTAGSAVLKNAAPAKEDAALVKRLRAAGAVIIGRTNMAEFASSAVGLNPHYGTPRNVWDRATGRVPGGSSSGAGVAVPDGMCTVAIGSDTGGSIRIPAALNGIVGFKPTQRRVPLEGCHMLSDSLDSFGPLANSVMCCALVDAALAGEAIEPPAAIPLDRLTFAVPRNGFFLDNLDEHVGPAFERALKRLSAKGARIVEIAIPALEDLLCVTAAMGVPSMVGKAPLALLVPGEAYANHRHILEKHAAQMDPMIAATLQYGASLSAADYCDMLKARRIFIDSIGRALAGFGALLTPTLAAVAPTIASLTKPDDYNAANMRLSRNPAAINIMDGCALTIPCHEKGSAPVGLMLSGVGGQDKQILAAGLAVEAALS